MAGQALHTLFDRTAAGSNGMTGSNSMGSNGTSSNGMGASGGTGGTGAGNGTQAGYPSQQAPYTQPDEQYPAHHGAPGSNGNWSTGDNGWSTEPPRHS